MDASQSNSLTLVVTLTIRNEQLSKFREFERLAAKIMLRYGGRIERTVVIPPARGGEFYKEIHIVTFPDEQSLQAYRDDAESKTLIPLREACIYKTEAWKGKKGPDYLAVG